jgi:lipoprotein NlpI
VILAAVVVGAWLGLASSPQAPQDLADAAEADFASGHLAEAVAKYDRLATLVPEVAPMLWQRGVALYELGRYDACAQQFTAYFAVNRSDLENATWQFLCAARRTSPEAARANLLAAGPDPRILRTEIYEMVRGRMTPEALMALADTSVPIVRFYAHFYVGYYLEATGRPAEASPHFRAAASPELTHDAGFLAVVARVHLARLGEPAARP